MTKKIYESVGYRYMATPIIIDGVQRMIVFDTGHSQRYFGRGIYATTDVDEQKAIESKKSFGIDFKLVGTEDVPDEGKPLGDLSKITSGKDAKTFLNENYDIPMASLTNNDMIRAEAEKLGIVFPEWKN